MIIIRKRSQYCVYLGFQHCCWTSLLCTKINFHSLLRRTVMIIRTIMIW